MYTFIRSPIKKKNKQHIIPTPKTAKTWKKPKYLTCNVQDMKKAHWLQQVSQDLADRLHKNTFHHCWPVTLNWYTIRQRNICCLSSLWQSLRAGDNFQYESLELLLWNDTWHLLTLLFPLSQLFLLHTRSKIPDRILPPKTKLRTGILKSRHDFLFWKSSHLCTFLM